jgi:hypothetical protein
MVSSRTTFAILFLALSLTIALGSTSDAFADSVTKSANIGDTSSAIDDFSNRNNAFASDNAYAQGDDGEDQAYGFPDFGIPTGATINGITVSLEGNRYQCASFDDHPRFDVQLSTPGLAVIDINTSSDFTGDEKTTSNYGSSDSTKTVGGSSDKWGLTHTATQLDDLYVLVTVDCKDNGEDMKLDHLQVSVDYTPVIVDTDGDGVPDGSDICSGGDDNVDTDADLTPDFCDTTPNGDDDGDGIDNLSDLCPGGDDNVDTDADLTPDFCDTTPNGDDDGDGVDNLVDICPGGDDNVDTDADLTPDFCDTTPNGDDDGDGVDNLVDICPGGDDNVDTDADLTPDFCDTTPNGDDDGDGVDNLSDLCPDTAANVTVNQDGCPTGSIQGQKYEDKNGNAIHDNGEPFLNIWTIFLDENDNQILDDGEVFTITGYSNIYGEGNYLFEDIPLGDYVICEVFKNNWAQTQPGIPQEPQCYEVTLSTPDQIATGFDFGNVNLGIIEGKKYYDTNLNGQEDNGEPGLNGWTIFLDENGNQTLDGNERTAITHFGPDAKPGFFEFTGVFEGHYNVCEVLQDLWEQTQPGSAHDPACYEVTIDRSGQVIKDLDFGNYNFEEQGAELIIIKNVINNNGGTAVPADFTMIVQNPLFEPQTSFAGVSGEGVLIAIDAGETIVTEVESPLYNSSYDGDCNFTAVLGERYTCIITNNDKAPGLTLVKSVINDNGGDATPADFVLTATGPSSFAGAGPIVESDDSFVAGAYSLSESTLFGYTAGDWVCQGGTQNGNTIALGLDESATCTVTNDDIAPTLTVFKSVINDNGGSAVSGDFTMIVQNSLFDPTTSFAGSAEGVLVTINAGQTTVTEDKPQQYMGDGGVGDCDFVAKVGTNYTCTITNDDLAPGLTLEMNLVKDDSGIAVPSEFTLSADGATPFSGNGPMVQSGDGIVAGIYSLNATGSNYYTYSDWTCSEFQIDGTTVSLPFGAAVLCSVTINDKPSIDGDPIPDQYDNCIEIPNADQQDIDANGIGDVCEDKGGDNQWDTRPTFGVSHETRETMIVDNGFAFNENSFTLTDNHHTPFDEQVLAIGTLNTFAAKVYADKDLKVQEFLFGVPEIGMGHLAEMRVEVWYDVSGEIADIKVVQSSEVIDRSSLSVSSKASKCMSADTENNCTTTTMSAVFLEPLADKVMAIKAIDWALRDQTTYLNEGFDVTGDSLNPMATKMIPSTVKGEGLIQVTQNEKYSDYWTTQDGRIFEMNSFGSFKWINPTFERFQDSGEALTRQHSGFGKVVDSEAQRAIAVFDSASLKSELPPSFSYDITITERITPEVLQEMQIQQHIAQKILDAMDKQARWN